MRKDAVARKRSQHWIDTNTLMNIQPNQKLFGFPALEIRRLLRECGFAGFSTGIVAETLRITRSHALRLVRTLTRDGLMVEVSNNLANVMCRLSTEGDRVKFYQLTIKGHALRMTTARKRIKRATADRLVKEFLKRVNEVNANPDVMFWIDEVIAFGSFVDESPTLSDVDLAVLFVPKTQDRELWLSLAKERVAKARSNGRHFTTFVEKLGWPRREIELYLRKGMTALHLHDMREKAELINILPYQTIYVRPQSELVSCPCCAHTISLEGILALTEK